MGIAASTKDSLTFMISSIRPINRLQDMSANAKGPFQPPIFTQPLKLKSVLKNSKEKFQLITPHTIEKINVKRPQSCGGVQQRNSNTLIEKSIKTINSDLNDFKQIRNNFTNLDDPYHGRDRKEEEINKEKEVNSYKINRPKNKVN